MMDEAVDVARKAYQADRLFRASMALVDEMMPPVEEMDHPVHGFIDGCSMCGEIDGTPHLPNCTWNNFVSAVRKYGGAE